MEQSKARVRVNFIGSILALWRLRQGFGKFIASLDLGLGWPGISRIFVLVSAAGQEQQHGEDEDGFHSGFQFTLVKTARYLGTGTSSFAYRPGSGKGFCKLHFQQVNQVQSVST